MAVAGALQAPRTLTVRSDAFAHGKPVPREHTGHGDDVSPPLAWSGVPERARAIAILMDDPDAPGGTFTHWTVWDLPPGTTSLPKGADVQRLGARVGTNDFDATRYMGPAPPHGTHRYFFRVLALDQPLGLEPGARAERIWTALQGRVLAWGELMGTFTRP